MDFIKIFPAFNFVNEFQNKLTQLCDIIKKDTKNPQMKTLIADFPVANVNSKVAIIIAGLHFLLYTHKSLAKGYNRPSILDTIDSMLYLTDDADNIDSIIEQRRQHLASLNLTFLPFIVVRGEKYSTVSDDVILVLESIKYSFFSLLKALESLVKIYVVFDLEWPKVNATVYRFLERAFLNVERGSDEHKVQRLIQDLTQE